MLPAVASMDYPILDCSWNLFEVRCVVCTEGEIRREREDKTLTTSSSMTCPFTFTQGSTGAALGSTRAALYWAVLGLHDSTHVVCTFAASEEVFDQWLPFRDGR